MRVSNAITTKLARDLTAGESFWLTGSSPLFGVCFADQDGQLHSVLLPEREGFFGRPVLSPNQAAQNMAVALDPSASIFASCATHRFRTSRTSDVLRVGEIAVSQNGCFLAADNKGDLMVIDIQSGKTDYPNEPIVIFETWDVVFADVEGKLTSAIRMDASTLSTP